MQLIITITIIVSIINWLLHNTNQLANNNTSLNILIA